MIVVTYLLLILAKNSLNIANCAFKWSYWLQNLENEQESCSLERRTLGNSQGSFRVLVDGSVAPSRELLT